MIRPYNAYMKPTKSWKLTLIDAGDGSGDALIELPDELLAMLGWVEGDSLEFKPSEKCIVIKNMTVADRSPQAE